VVRILGVVGEVQEALEGGAVGHVVVALAALFLDHFALDVELLLGQRGGEVAHAVGFEPEAEGQVVRGEGLEVVGAVEERRPVQHPAHGLDVAEVLVVADVLGAGEEHVLEKVSETGAARALVLGADVVPEVDRDERGGVVFVEHHAQAVRETVVFESEHRRDVLSHGGGIVYPCAP
jgi:hypothetical protein